MVHLVKRQSHTKGHNRLHNLLLFLVAGEKSNLFSSVAVAHFSLGRMMRGCLGQRLLRVNSFLTTFWAFPNISAVLVSSWV